MKKGKKAQQKTEQKKQNSMVAEEVKPDLYAAIKDPEEREKFKQLEKYRISTKSKITPDQPCLSIDGVDFFNKGNIHAIKGAAKAGKTTAAKAIISALMKGKMFHLQSKIKKAKVIYFDSEQSDEDAKRIINDVKQITGLANKYIDRHLSLYALRKLDCTQLLSKIESAIKHLKPDVVFIDGIVDFVKSFNDEKESMTLIRELMRMSSEYNCAIVNMLHTNPGEAGGKMRGHLGTLLSQKAATVLECRKNARIITVTSAETRHAEIPSWSISFGNDGCLEDGNAKHQAEVEKAAANKKQKQEQKTAQTLQERIDIAIGILNEQGPLKRSLFSAALKSALGLGDTTIKGLIKAMLDSKIIIQSKDNIIQINTQELPFI